MSRIRPSTVALAGALALAVLAPAAQAQYKWKDSRGQVHISDRPPPQDVPEQNILQRPRSARPAAAPVNPAATSAASAAATASSASAPARPQADPELEARRKKQEAEANAQQRAEQERQAQLRADNCDRARQQIATLESGQRMVRITPQGERVVVDDAMRASDLQRARAAAEVNCR